MNFAVREKCDLLLQNRNELTKVFKFENNMMGIVASQIYVDAGRRVEPARLKECKKMLEKNTGILSSFRSTAKMIVISKMAVSDNPQQYLATLKNVYSKMTKGVFADSGYLIQASILICDAGRADEADSIIAKYRVLYKKMSKKHPMLTSSEDISYAVLLAMTDKDVDTIISQIEECFHYLKKEKKINVGANEIQGVAEVLALANGDLREKCDKVALIYETFKKQGVKYGKYYNQFASLGTLTDIEIDTEELVNEIIETSNYLKHEKGFGGFSMDGKMRLVFAVMLVGGVYTRNSEVTNNSIITSTVALVVAEQIAVMICIMAATSSAAYYN